MRLKKEQQKNRKNVTVRMSNDERNRAMQKAMAYTNGDLSKWVRYAAQNCVPRKKDMEKNK